MKKLCFTLLVVTMLILGCKKDNIVTTVTNHTNPTIASTYTEPPCDTTYIEFNSNDTIYPSDYLMAYPGSWWNYSNGTSKTSNSWAMVQTKSKETNGNCVTITSDFHIVPSTSFGLIYNQSTLNINTIPSRYSRLVSEGLGEFYNYHIPFGSGQYSGYNYTKRSTINHFDSLIVNGITYYDVIRIYETFGTYYYHMFGGPSYSDSYDYAKNIGLIQIIDGIDPSNLSEDTIKLTSYFIAPH